MPYSGCSGVGCDFDVGDTYFCRQIQLYDAVADHSYHGAGRDQSAAAGLVGGELLGSVHVVVGKGILIFERHRFHEFLLGGVLCIAGYCKDRKDGTE